MYVFSNSQKEFWHLSELFGPKNRGYQSFFQVNNSISIFKIVKVTPNFYNFLIRYTIVESENDQKLLFVGPEHLRNVWKHFCELQNTLPKALLFIVTKDLNFHQYTGINLHYATGPLDFHLS